MRNGLTKKLDGGILGLKPSSILDLTFIFERTLVACRISLTLVRVTRCVAQSRPLALRKKIPFSPWIFLSVSCNNLIAGPASGMWQRVFLRKNGEFARITA